MRDSGQILSAVFLQQPRKDKPKTVFSGHRSGGSEEGYFVLVHSATSRLDIPKMYALVL